MSSSNVFEMKDDYTCFVVSDKAQYIECQKFHICSWWNKKSFFKERDVLVEIGLQIKIEEGALKTLNGNRYLEFDVIEPWIDEKTKTNDLYPSVKEKKNARFIFNEDVDRADSFDGGDSLTGVLLNFQEPIYALPTNISVSEGKASVTVAVPENVRFLEYPIYIRFVVSVVPKKLCYVNAGLAKGVYAYDVKINQPRNLPSAYRKDQLCLVKKSYCIHIVPSHYQLVFSGPKTFKSVRMLEHNRYTEYVKGVPLFAYDINPNKYKVVFNKCEDGSNLFYTVFESEHIGILSILIAFLINLLCSFFMFFLEGSPNKIDVKESMSIESDSKSATTSTTSRDVQINSDDRRGFKDDCVAPNQTEVCGENS